MDSETHRYQLIMTALVEVCLGTAAKGTRNLCPGQKNNVELFDTAHHKYILYAGDIDNIHEQFL